MHVTRLKDQRAKRAFGGGARRAVGVQVADTDLIALDRIQVVSNILRPYNP
jgi:hypothetical protein